MKVSICLMFCAVLLWMFIAGDLKARAEPPPLILTHYMPWYAAKPTSQAWGWHWTMNHFDPDKQMQGKREVASHYYPTIGPYDSCDQHVIEYQLLTMKLAGIDGVIVDWYGLTDYRDYAKLHDATTRLLQQCERLNMKFVICYEDQTIPSLVDAKRLNSSDRVKHAKKELQWLEQYWFRSGSYALLDNKPILLSFGQTGLSDSEWFECLDQVSSPLAYFSQHHRRRAAVGAFDWPAPSNPDKSSERFENDSKTWPHAIPVAYPRFVDIYAEAKVGTSYGKLEDDGGERFTNSLERALRSKAPIVQLATWNDWGEGTQIEPSLEFGTRDLETVQRLRRKYIESSFGPQKKDLDLPRRLLDARRKTDTDPQQLERIVSAILQGKLNEADERLIEKN